MLGMGTLFESIKQESIKGCWENSSIWWRILKWNKIKDKILVDVYFGRR